MKHGDVMLRRPPVVSWYRIPELLLSLSVNYWYDMQFDIKYNYYNFLQNVNSVNRKMSKIWEGYQQVIEKFP